MAALWGGFKKRAPAGLMPKILTTRLEPERLGLGPDLWPVQDSK